MSTSTGMAVAVNAFMGTLPVARQWETWEGGDQDSTPTPTPRHGPDERVRDLRVDESAEWRSRYIKLNESHHHDVQTLAKWTERFIKRCSFNQGDKGRHVFVCGDPGCGKSHAAKRVFKWMDGFSVDLWDDRKWPSPPKTIMLDWARVAEETQQFRWDDYLDQIKSSHVVILDDVGAESDQFKSGIPIDRLRRVLEVCERKWLFLTSNIPRTRWLDKWDARVASRLSACHYLYLNGVPDYRPKLRG